ncbi:MAG: hypothetical protein QOF37_347 [Thermoleophilaceae bacterium]|jgi:hypothetical protein|nr:hypothetical protein [Thermoleophilaceae bacterium]
MAQTSTDSAARRREILEDTSRAAIAAHDAHVQEAIESVDWERRGVLQTLTRVRRRSGEAADAA